MALGLKVKQAIIEQYGEAYKSFGLNKMMGHIVALLLFSPYPLSLSEIAHQVGRTKGPVSQILQRLKDRKLVRKVWKHEDNRSDYYEIEPEVFLQAFRNHNELIKKNKRIAKEMLEMLALDSNNDFAHFAKRMEEMECFYELMEKHNQEFIKEWNNVKEKFK